MGRKLMLILGIETSCDETSVAIVRDGKEVLSNLILSQLDVHSEFGGVVPELACRRHLEVINPLMEQAIQEAKITWKDIDAVAVTRGPGLVGAVLIGVAAAKALALSLDIPLIGVNHLEAHIYSNYLQEAEMPFPAIALLVSGGHTSLVYLKKHGEYEIIGETRDDAAGEAFDKVARMLNLGYPGGPIIDKLSNEGNREAVVFPRAMMEKKDNYDFSFSGLKTAVVYYLKSEESKTQDKANIAAGFQEAVVDVLVTKTLRAAKKYGVSHVLLAGGVARNSRLRNELKRRARSQKITFHIPSPILCTDNAAMVATVGYFMLQKGMTADLSLDAVPNLPLV